MDINDIMYVQSIDKYVTKAGDELSYIEYMEAIEHEKDNKTTTA